jgi:hypothetical protein
VGLFHQFSADLCLFQHHQLRSLVPPSSPAVRIAVHAPSGLAALQLLRNEQLSAAVDNLVTEDFAELGVNDRGREIRSIVDDIIRVSALWCCPTLLRIQVLHVNSRLVVLSSVA